MLDDPGCRRALCDAVAGADRLVLLGDVVELREGPARDAIAVARPVLEAVAAALGDRGPVVLLAGNHDHGLIAPWLLHRGPEPALGTASTVPVSGGPLADIVDALGASRTTVAYPGSWLRPAAWATHGHYADRHTTVPMLERIGAGVMARIARQPPGGPARAEDYESALAPMYAWIDALAALGGPGTRGDGGFSVGAWETLAGADAGSLSLARQLRRRALRAGLALGVAAVNRTSLAPLSADLSGTALRRGPLRGMVEVVGRLGVDAPGGDRAPARHVLYGHTHRAGPLPGDDAAEWRTPGGAGLLNVGCWVHEPLFEGSDPARSPYRPGFAAWLDDDPAIAPELVNLLD